MRFVPVESKYFKTSNIEDADERSSLTLGAVQRPVDSHDDPLEEPLIESLADGLHSKLALKQKGVKKDAMELKAQNKELAVDRYIYASKGEGDA